MARRKSTVVYHEGFVRPGGRYSILVNVLGVSLGHDSSFAVVENGRLREIMEAERYFRQKRYKLHCLTLAPGKHRSGFQFVDIEDLRLFLTFVARDWGLRFDAVAVQNQGRVEEFNNLIEILRDNGFTFARTYHVDHHLSHAALAYYTSPFPEAVILSYDGMGNDGYTVVFQGSGAAIHYLERNPRMFGRSYNNLGYIVGLKPDVAGSTAGKTMGLAGYGNFRTEWVRHASEYVTAYTKLPPFPVDGISSYGKAHRINPLGLTRIQELQQFLRPAAEPPTQTWRDRLRAALGHDQPQELRLPGPEDALAQDLVHTVQHVWTQQVLDILRRFRATSRNLCVVGGCALNGITNYAAQQAGLFTGMHLLPNPTDCGLSAGAALHAYYALSETSFTGCDTPFSPYLGTTAFDIGELPSLRARYPHRTLDEAVLPTVLARLLHRNLVVGLMRGRYEVGPRALGNRSILCNPLNLDMKTMLNEKVKHREWYRPFAPVVTAEDASRFFTNTSEIPYMSVICFTRPEFRKRLAAVTHVDGSARLQTVRQDQHPLLYAALKAFERLSGVPVLLNTSFNPGGEPILNYCAVGLDMLRTTGLDFVCIENTLFARPGNEAALDNLLLD
ncbi:MAG: hypothetical protein FI707_14325 [SAR202 cluster bacterium]|nr:hypothetical protein [Acidobacteriota bacterium]MQG56399.1 hypothetical protein [SAR202 cluster bacterium]MQG69951.1 hypothetical protein [SAR202 cluster bacterium]HAL47868.1 hypothetical protein [Dehalococcoidia bacterium]